MIKKLKPLFILLGAMLLSYILWFLGQVQPDPVEESPAPDVIVEILTPKDFQVKIISSGTTTPLTQTILNAEVGGEIQFIVLKSFRRVLQLLRVKFLQKLMIQIYNSNTKMLYYN